jgi:predicted dehydrogenase
MKTKVWFALVGAGAFGVSLAKYIRADPGGELRAICERDEGTAAKAAAELGRDIAVVTDYQALLRRDDIDAVALCTPNNTHADLAIAAAQTGRHVFCEKPMANSVEDCWAMVAAARAAKVKLMVGHKRRLRAPWARMIELATGGHLGRVSAINATTFHWDTHARRPGNWWLRKASSGGLLQKSCPHAIDAMNAMAAPRREPAEWVSAVYGPQQEDRFDFPDLMSLTIRYRSGAIAMMQSSVNYPLRRFRESSGPWVQLTEGAIELRPARDHIEVLFQRVDEAEPHRERFNDLGFDGAYTKEIGDFIRWVRDGQEPCLTWREGLRAVEVIDAAYRSAESGSAPVRLPLCPERETEWNA